VYFIKERKKNIHIKTKENIQQNTVFARTSSLRRSWRFVCYVQGGGFVCGFQNDRCPSNTPNETAG